MMIESNRMCAFLKKGQFRVVYEALKAQGYSYCIENLERDFRGLNPYLKYSYLLYVISKEPRPDLHLLACEFLVYTDTICDDVYTLVRWHILQTLSVEPMYTKALKWAVSYFLDHPSSPFSEAELQTFRLQIQAD